MNQPTETTNKNHDEKLKMLASLNEKLAEAKRLGVGPLIPGLEKQVAALEAAIRVERL